MDDDVHEKEDVTIVDGTGNPPLTTLLRATPCPKEVPKEFTFMFNDLSNLFF